MSVTVCQLDFWKVLAKNGNESVDSLKWMYFHGNETNICVIESIFSGNDQQKEYYTPIIMENSVR